MTLREHITILLAGAVLAACANAALAANLFMNPGFETPGISAVTVRNLDGSTASGVGGWLTTHPVGNVCGGSCRPIELWSNNFIVPASQGTQIMELNSIQRNMVFQSLSVAPGDVLHWSFHHRWSRQRDESGYDGISHRYPVGFALGVPVCG